MKEKSEPRFPNVDWYCDICGDHLNSQENFNDHKYVWKCTKCGHKNSISKDNIDYPYKKASVRFLSFLISLARSFFLYNLILLGLLFFLNVRIGSGYFLIYYSPIIYFILLFVSVAFERSVLGYNKYHSNFFSSLFSLFNDVTHPLRELFNVVRLLFDLFHPKSFAFALWIKQFLKSFLYIAIIIYFFLQFNNMLHFRNIQWINLPYYLLSRITKSFGSLQNVIIFYYLIINIISFFIYRTDKKKAEQGAFRISENTLLLYAFLGGGIGALGAMFVFKHKIRKPLFVTVVPLFIILHLVLWMFLLLLLG